MSWTHLNSQNKSPVGRWGHTTVVHQEVLYLFGGYDGNYLNDLRTFDFHTKIWTSLKVSGKKPEPRSNHVMLLYQSKILLTGGGGASKCRFGDLHILDLNTNHWTNTPLQLTPRTYHAGCIGSDKLYLYGGESGYDTDILEAIDLQSLTVTQLLSSSTTKPERRRFATLEYIDGKLYLVGGCTQNYIPTQNIYVGLPSQNTIVWDLFSLQFNKWGHSCQQFEGQMYIFGGRDTKDSNELYQINVQTPSIKRLKDQEIVARRKHSVALLGNCLIIFGGFNGQYLKDFNFFELPLFQEQKIEFQELSQYQFEGKFKRLNDIEFIDHEYDAIVYTDEKGIGVSQGKLISCSGYFRGLFGGEFMENVLKQVNLLQVNSQAFQVVVLFSEYQKLILPILNEQELFNLLELAEYLDMDDLRYQLKQYIAQVVDRNDLLTVYRLSMHHQDDELQKYCAYRISGLEIEPLGEINNVQREQVNDIKKMRKLSLLK